MVTNAFNDTGIKHIWDKIIAKLALKVDKETGKGLSTNDYTTAEKNKLAGLDGSKYMVRGVDRVTAGVKSGSTIGSSVTIEGGENTASNFYAHAEGYGTTASGGQAHSEGANTTASGNNSHAEGYGTTASGTYGAHAEGCDTVASGIYGAHAEGRGTIASGTYQHVQGKYNIEDTNNVYAHIVGNGSSSERSNAHTLDWQGNAWFAGDIETASFSIINGALNITFEV